MADQYYNASENKFWIDLHKCATIEAASILEIRIKECFKYGVDEIEVIYGTPDIYEGSIEQATKEITKNDEKVASTTEIHAGIVIKISKNPIPMPQDTSMSFAGFTAKYQSEYKYEPFEREYFPCRKEFSTVEVRDDVGCTLDYIRCVVSELSDEHAESVKEYNDDTRRNETTWRIYKKGADEVAKRWQNDSNEIRKILQDLGANDDEVESILMTTRKPLDPKKPAESRLKGALTRIRRNRDK